MVRSSAYRMGLNSDTMLKRQRCHAMSSLLAGSITEMPTGKPSAQPQGQYLMTNELIATQLGRHGSKLAAYRFFIFRLGGATPRQTDSTGSANKQGKPWTA
ncbi:hypothetical protein [Aquitalea aquatica]|uniref:Uncharacterized protein n=1 Tax=Aquitalea aquatica TaxID=3044273 RepID=A0A838XXG5_9NEIS|nr:hypothetical protein [Aquitalea magnusonii]MBA4707860.1 hypothetical protein [Aquitalea magnusonii]